MLDLHEGILAEFAERAVHAESLGEYFGLSIVEPRHPPRAHLSAERLEHVRAMNREHARAFRARNRGAPASEERKAKNRECARRKRAAQRTDAAVLKAVRAQIRDMDRLAFLPAMTVRAFCRVSGLGESDINRPVFARWLVSINVGGHTPIVMGVQSSRERMEALRARLLGGCERVEVVEEAA